jgi:serine protease Do
MDSMRPKRFGIVLAGSVVAWAAGLAAAPSAPVTPKVQAAPEVRALSRAMVDVARALQPSVVRLDVESERPRVAKREREKIPPELEKFFERFFGEDFEVPPGPGKGTGSGLVLDGAGNIITNSHVVEKATKVTVTMADGRELPAKVIGFDKQTDVAVVRLQSPPRDLVAARIGDSSKVEVGEWVLAVGSPLGLDQSVTAGIISSKGRVGKHVSMSGDRVREYIQTDAKINPGNSGGPLANLDAEVIGINTLINTGPGGAYGFAIPMNVVRRVAQSLLTDGRVRHAFLGIFLGDIKDGQRLTGDGEPDRSQGEVKGAPPLAAWVTKIKPDSPAQRAGVHVGDVIVGIDGQKIEGARDVVDYVASRSVGTKVSVAYVRDGRAGNLQITLAELPQEDEVASAEAHKDDSGLSMQTLTPEIARFLNVDPTSKGAVVTEVAPGSAAGRAGLKADDVIVEIDHKPVTAADEASAALKAPSKTGHVLRVRRAGTVVILMIKPQAPAPKR